MFIIYPLVFGILLSYITGGRLKNMVQRPIYWKALVFVAITTQLLFFSNLPFFNELPEEVIVISHYASYLCLLIFIVRNIKNFGISMVGIGAFLNALVIFLNGGYMPTIPQNLEKTSAGNAASAIAQGAAVNNSAKMTENTLLPWLGDVFYLPTWIPFSNVFSIGDVIIAVGICIYLVMNMRPVGNS